MKAWYVLYTKPNSESHVAQAVTARGLVTYLPLLTCRRGHSEPLFPRYLFVYYDLKTAGTSILRWIPGLCRIVSFGGRPAMIPDQAIDLIMTRLSENQARGDLPRHQLQPSDEAHIRDEPFADLHCVFQESVSSGKRAQILFGFLSRVNTDGEQVDAAQVVSQKNTRRPHRRSTRGKGRRIHYRGRGCADNVPAPAERKVQ